MIETSKSGLRPGDFTAVAVEENSEAVATVNRNAPCPCGSGRRYKGCCGAVTTRAMRAASPPVGSLTRRAVALQREGRLVDAAALYRPIATKTFACCKLSQRGGSRYSGLSFWSIASFLYVSYSDLIC
jgi:hypothetical protein